MRLDHLIKSGQVTDQAELARVGHVSRARLTRIMNRLQLVLDTQEAIVYLPRLLLLANPSESDQILEQVVACIVTTDEHDKLSSIPAEVVGWDRYSQAGIVVVDMFH